MRRDVEKRKKALTCVMAACLALAVAVLALLALYPSGSGARYVKSEVYEGTELYIDETYAHGDHADWVDLNDTKTSTTATEGVSWSNDTCSISAGGKYFLSSDLTANLKITPVAVRDSDGNISSGEVILCLDGYALTCADAETSAILIGNAGGSDPTASDVVFSLYDCGDGKSVNRYKYRENVIYSGTTFDEWDETSDAEVFHKGYVFDSSLSDDTCDGYVRGGLITGASFTSTASNNNPSRYYGGGVTVGRGCTFNMYGGTIAGNYAKDMYESAGVFVLDGTFNMYGGMIAGNCSDYNSTSSPAGSGVGLYGGNSGYPKTVNMYGGEIKENYKHSGGAGICGYCVSLALTVNMYGGTVSDNVSDGSGGGIMLNTSSSGTSHVFHMEGGTVRDNVSGGNTSRYGGGVYMGGSSSVCEVLGGSVYGNRALNASGLGGGIYFGGSWGTGSTHHYVALGGSAYIYGNYAGGKISNLDLYSNSSSASYITLSSNLTEGARVGVTVYGTQTQITNGGADYLEASVGYIISDDRSYGVHVTGSGTSAYLELYEL